MEETLNRSKMVCCSSEGLDLELECCIESKDLSQITAQHLSFPVSDP